MNNWTDGLTTEEIMGRLKAFNDAEETHLRALLLPLCAKHGYGRLMQLISKWWQEGDPVGALSVGPCYGVLYPSLKKPRSSRSRKKR